MKLFNRNKGYILDIDLCDNIVRIKHQIKKLQRYNNKSSGESVYTFSGNKNLYFKNLIYPVKKFKNVDICVFDRINCFITKKSTFTITSTADLHRYLVEKTDGKICRANNIEIDSNGNLVLNESNSKSVFSADYLLDNLGCFISSKNISEEGKLDIVNKIVDMNIEKCKTNEEVELVLKAVERGIKKGDELDIVIELVNMQIEKESAELNLEKVKVFKEKLGIKAKSTEETQISVNDEENQ